MGHTNSTANLALPQFIGTDKPTWLSDVNGAFAAIDTYAGNNDAALAITDAKADTAVNDAASAVTTATNAANTAGTASTQATNAVTVAGNALTVANGINSKVGVLTDLHTTDKSTVVAAINEVNDAIVSPTAAQVSYNNSVSGLTATDVQAAIDEVAQGVSTANNMASADVHSLTLNTPYTAAADAYVFCDSPSGGTRAFAEIAGANNDVVIKLQADDGVSQSLFIRKGMIVTATALTGAGAVKVIELS